MSWTLGFSDYQHLFLHLLVTTPRFSFVGSTFSPRALGGTISTSGSKDGHVTQAWPIHCLALVTSRVWSYDLVGPIRANPGIFAGSTGKEASLAVTVAVRAGQSPEVSAYPLFHYCQPRIKPTWRKAGLRDGERQICVSRIQATEALGPAIPDPTNTSSFPLLKPIYSFFISVYLICVSVTCSQKNPDKRPPCKMPSPAELPSKVTQRCPSLCWVRHALGWASQAIYFFPLSLCSKDAKHESFLD